jgi:hypothetical protein
MQVRPGDSLLPPILLAGACRPTAQPSREDARGTAECEKRDRATASERLDLAQHVPRLTILEPAGELPGPLSALLGKLRHGARLLTPGTHPVELLRDRAEAVRRPILLGTGL